MKHILTLFFAGALLQGFAQELSKDAQSLMERAKMTFEASPDLVPSEPIENRQMNWEFSFRHPEKKFEVRYAIRPMDEQLKEYEAFQKNKKPGDIMIHPNNWYTSVFDATVLNISGGQLPESTTFPPKAVKSEFNADWGATVLVGTGAEFGLGYAYCLVVMIHKDNVGDAYMFYMGDEQEVIVEEMDKIFHALKFQ